MRKLVNYFDTDGFRTDLSVRKNTALVTACEEAGTNYFFNATHENGQSKARYSILKRSIYQLGAKNLGKRGLGKLAVRAYQSTVDAREGRALPINAPLPEENPYYYLYYIALGSEIEEFCRQERDKACNQLLYAAKHDVPVEFLIGFINQCGSYSHLLRKLRAGEMEPWWHWRHSR